jgi:membrane-associated protease RseP (regulator of RpoE activity)
VRLRELLYLLGWPRPAARSYGHEVVTFDLPHEGPVQFARWLHPNVLATTVRQEEVSALRTFLRPGDVVVVSVIPEGPAAKQDLRSGDIITKVDGQPVKGRWLQDVVDLIRGPDGKPVKLTINRPKGPASLEIEIVRGRVDIPVVESKMLEGKIGYVWLRSFNKQSFAKLQETQTGDTLSSKNRPATLAPISFPAPAE